MTSEWHEVPLRELVGYISKGIAPSYAEEASETTIRVLNQKCNRNFRISYGDSRLHDTLKKKVPPERYVKPDDILINSTGAGTAGRIAQIEDVPSATTIDGHMILIRSNGKVTQKFLGYALKAHQWEVLQLDEGSTGQTELNRDRLLDEIMINYPVSFDEQNAIVGTLESIDRKLIVNKEINDNLLQQAIALFDNALQQSESISFVELGSLADVKGGKRLPKGVNLITKPNSHPYIRVRDLNNVIFASLSSDYAYVDDETQKSIARYITSAGDVLVSIVGTIGLTAIVDDTLANANLTENCVKLTNLKGIIPEYLLLFLRSKEGIEAINKGTVGAVQLKLPIKNIQSIPVPLLLPIEMQALDDILSVIFNRISTNVIEVKMLSELRDTLLPKLISGELSVSKINY